MQKSTSFTLGEHFERFIAEQINSGRYMTASETVRAALRLLEERESAIQGLKQALIDGEKSGVGEYSLKGLIEELDEESAH